MSPPQTRRVLLVAARSFIAGHVRAALEARGWAVVAVERGAADRARRCDLGDERSIEEALRAHAPDAVVNCAAATGADDPPERLYEVHVLGTLRLLRAAATAAPHAAVVLFGSAAEYGEVAPDALPVDESRAPGPLSLFGASKLAQTQLAQAAAAAWRLRATVVRPFNVVGPGMPTRYLAAALAARLEREADDDTPFPVANAEATRDFVDVRDVADAVVAVIESGATAAGRVDVYNVASGRETRVLELAAELCRLAGRRTAVASAAGASRSGISRSAGDASRLTRATGWVPRRTWRESVADLWRARVPSQEWVARAREQSSSPARRDDDDE